MGTQNTILLTIDVEDWFQVENLRPWFPPSQWPNQQLRVKKNTRKLLELFDKHNIKATFFVLGWIAERCPDLITDIAKHGHEIASHGYSHMLCTQMEPESLLKDLQDSKELLENITGNEIKGYRAPNFSITDDTLHLVYRSGYQYDSSYNSFDKHSRYGRISTNGHSRKGIAINWYPDFYELPISNLNLAGQTIPWGGGGYFRFFPLPLFTAGIRKIVNKTGAYIFYMHPWEIDPDQPVIRNNNRALSWRHYLNLDKTYSRLSKMLKRFNDYRFQTCGHYLSEITKSLTIKQESPSRFTVQNPHPHAQAWECIPSKEN